MVALVGPLATRSRESGQARKGAAVAGAASAGVWLAGTASLRAEYGCSQLPITFCNIPVTREYFAAMHAARTR